MLVTVITIFLLVNSVNSCVENKDKFHDRSQFLSKFPNNYRLDNVSLIGTIGSGSYKKHTLVPSRTQLLSIKQQLKHGVRVLDLNLRATSNRFALHTGPIYLGLFLEDVLSDVEDFLEQNPREFVVLLLKEDYLRAEDVTMSNCEIIDTYVNRSERIVTNWNLKGTFKKVRGKVLLATQVFGGGFDGCAVNLHEKCSIQNKECTKSKSVEEIDSKWEDILHLQIATFHKRRHCFVNNLYCFGSKHSADVIANHGYFNSDGECIEPINRRMATYFVNPHRGLIIIVASFVTQELIDKINFSNFEQSDNNYIKNLQSVIRI